MNDVEKRRFLWGVSLAWSPALLLLLTSLLGVVNSFRGISEQKATGVVAVAGGLAEFFMIFGTLVTLAFQVTAILLLFRGFSRQHGYRSLLSVVSICLSVLMIFLLGTFVWVFFGGFYRAS